MSERRIDGLTAGDGFVAGLRGGTAAAFEALIDRYHQPLTAFLVRLLGDRSLAEEVAQDTFEAIFTSLHTLSDDRSFNAWLFTIARHKATPHLRRRAILQFVPLDPLVTRVGDWLGRDSGDAYDDVGMRDAIQTTLDRMPAKEREALLLHSVVGFTSREIAGILGIAEKAAAQRVYRARQRFATLYHETAGQFPSDVPERGPGPEDGEAR